LRLLPKDAQWHAGFADLLGSRSYWDMSASGATPDTYRALDEIQTALQLAPNDGKVQQIAEQISYMFPDAMVKNGTGYDFVWLTETPTPRPSLAESAAPAATTRAATTRAPVQPATSSPPTAIPSSKPVSPPCGSAALVPLAIGFWAARKRRR
jgi:hypothetical protein